MIGYPWETLKNAQKTLDQAKTLFRRGLADSLQATIVIPYPGTALFKECDNDNLLLTKNWDLYDMRQPVMKSPISPKEQKQLIDSLFKVVWEPKFFTQKTPLHPLF